MFDELLRAARRMNQQKIAVPLETDAEGYLDRECPAEQCLFQFKVILEDWGKFDQPLRFCPLCGHAAPPKSWFTREQLDHAREQGTNQISAVFGKALAADAAAFNRRQPRGEFFSMSLRVSGFKGNSIMLPAPAKETLTLKIACEKCSTRFAVLGSAFFCPGCGHTSIERVFDDSIRKVLTKVDGEPEIRRALETAISRDAAALTCRSLLESGLSDCVGAFQSLGEAVYMRLKPADKPRRNAFQNLDEGDRLFLSATGKGYGSWLSAADLQQLQMYFQQRHLLAHKEGVVDQGYLDKSNDRRYSIGQRIVVKAADVRRLAELVGRLGENLRTLS